VPTLNDFTATTITGDQKSLGDFSGQVALVVNTASQCGFTPQFEGLEKLHQEYADQGLVVLGFPCNQFGNQDPGDNAEIGAFCERNYGVSFPMFEKIDVNGPETHPLYRWLKQARRGVLGTQRIKWNFTKFLLDRKGNPVARYAPRTEPQALTKDIEALL